MREAGVLVGNDDKPIYWHEPVNRTVASLPDSPSLWSLIWENRSNVKGFAHSHPGGGVPGPSHEDVTSFSAIELGLGRRLVWWIISEDDVIELKWQGPGPYDYVGKVVDHEQLPWWDDLYARSYQIAPKGTVWVCSACGKRARDRMTGGISHGWDVSCAMHAVLCLEDSIELRGGLVYSAKAVDGDNLQQGPA